MPARKFDSAVAILSSILFSLTSMCLASAAPTAVTQTKVAAAEPAKPAAAAPGQPLENLVNNWLKRPDLQHSFVGVEVMELPSGHVLYSSNGNRRFAPASTAKVFTTACAYTLLGPNYTYHTQLFAGGKVGPDSVHGDLILVPSEDPSLKADEIRQLFQSTLVQRKIRKIDGALVLLPPKGGGNFFAPSWLVEDFGQPWMPVCSDFVVDRNVSQGVVNFKGIRNQNVGAGDNFNGMERSLMLSDQAAGWLTYNPYAHEMDAYIGAGVTDKSPLSVTDPNEFNLAMASDMLENIGVHVGGKQNSPQAELLAEHVSKPLPVLLEHCLHHSDNLYAQQFLRTLALPAPGSKGSASNATLEETGLSRMFHWLVSIGVQTQELELLDGCGLSRKNGISPHALNTVLKYMAGPKVDGPFLSLMKESGTATRKGQFCFKTGSMDTVRSITGVLGTAGGQHLAVTIIINDHTQNIKAVGAALTDLISLLNEITNISYIPIGKDTTETKPVVQLTHPAVTYGTYQRTSHKRRRRS